MSYMHLVSPNVCTGIAQPRGIRCPWVVGSYLLSAIACAQPEAWAQGSVSARISEGNRLLAEGKHQQALGVFEQELSKSPQSIEALVGKGWALLRGGQASAALATCNQAVTQSLAVSTLWCRASTYTALDGDVGAFGDWEIILRLDPGYRDVYRERASLLWKRGKKSQAAEDLARYANADKSNHAVHFELAGWYRELGNEHQAVVELTEVLRIAPKKKEALRMRAAANLAIGEYANAIADVTRLIEGGEEDPLLYRLRAQGYAAMSNLDAAWRDLMKASTHAPQEEKTKYREEGDQYLMAWLTSERDDAKRIEMFELIGSLVSSESAARLFDLRYLTCRRAKQEVRAMRVVEEASASGLATLDMHLFAADLALRQGELGKLILWCRKGIQVSTIKDRDARRDLNYFAGEAHMKRQQYLEADAALRTAASYPGPAGQRAHLFLLLGYANYQLRQGQEALRFYTEALSISGPHQQQVAKNIAAVKAEFQIP